MEDMKILTNRPLSEELKSKLDALSREQNPILFAVAGDLSLESAYANTILAISQTHVFVVHETDQNATDTYEIARVEKATVKRMYGNAMLRLTIDGKTCSVFRFTYSVAALCDTAASFIENIHNGAD